MFFEFKEADLQFSAQQLHQLSREICQDQAFLQQHLEQDILQLQNILHLTLSSHPTHHPLKSQKSPQHKEDEEKTKMSSFLKSIEQTVQNSETKLISVLSQQNPKTKVDRRRQVQTPKKEENQTEIGGQTNEGSVCGSSSRMGKRPPVYHPPKKKGDLPQPPQRSKVGNFAPTKRPSIQAKKPSLPFSKHQTNEKKSLKVQDQLQSTSTKCHSESKYLTRHEIQALKSSSLEQQLRITPKPEIIQDYGVEKGLQQREKVPGIQFWPTKDISLKKMKKQVVSLQDYDREQLGYQAKQKQSRHTFLRKLAQHCQSLYHKSTPSPTNPHFHNLQLLSILLSHLNPSSTQYKAHDYFLARQIYKIAEHCFQGGSEEEEVGREGSGGGGGGVREMEVRSGGVVMRGVGIQKVDRLWVEQRIKEYRLALAKFFILPGLKKKTQPHNLNHINALLSLCQFHRKGHHRGCCFNRQDFNQLLSYQ